MLGVDARSGLLWAAVGLAAWQLALFLGTTVVQGGWRGTALLGCTSVLPETKGTFETV